MLLVLLCVVLVWLDLTHSTKENLGNFLKKKSMNIVNFYYTTQSDGFPLRNIEQGFYSTFKVTTEMQKMKMILYVFRAVKILISAFCVMLPCYLEAGCRHFGGMCFPPISATLKMEALGSLKFGNPHIRLHSIITQNVTIQYMKMCTILRSFNSTFP
jgi:hypothetical protein